MSASERAASMSPDELIAVVTAGLDADEKTARATKPTKRLYPRDPIEFVISNNDLTSPEIEAAEPPRAVNLSCRSAVRACRRCRLLRPQLTP